MKQSKERSQLVAALAKAEAELDELRNSDEPEDIIRGKMIQMNDKIRGIQAAIKKSV